MNEYTDNHQENGSTPEGQQPQSNWQPQQDWQRPNEPGSQNWQQQPENQNWQNQPGNQNWQNQPGNQNWQNQPGNQNWQSQPNWQNNPYNQPPRRQKNGMALASMLLGIISLINCCIPFFQFPLAAAAIVLAVISKKGRPFHGFAIAGLVIGIISVLISIGMTFYWGLVLEMMQDPEFMEMYDEIMRMYMAPTQQ